MDFSFSPRLRRVTHVDSDNIAQDHALSISADSGLLANDTNAGGDVLTALVHRPVEGSLHSHDDRSFLYTASNGIVGTDTICILATDAAPDSNEAPVNIIVSEPK